MHPKAIINGTSALFLLFTCALWLSSNANEGKTSYNLRVMETRFRKWMDKNKKEYKDKQEREERFGIYLSNIELIDSINSQNLSYNLIDNKFADMTNEEFKAKFAGPLTDIVPSYSHEKINTTLYQALPATVDWRKQGAVTPIKNQGRCGNFSADIRSYLTDLQQLHRWWPFKFQYFLIITTLARCLKASEHGLFLHAICLFFL